MNEKISVDVGEKFFHDLAGWFMMPLAVLLLMLVIGVLRRLFTPPMSDQPASIDMLIVTVIAGKTCRCG